MLSPFVFLLGPRACGKSTVGRLLAASRSDRFIDLDAHVLATFDEKTVGAVWAARGEAAWREAEARVLSDLLAGTTDPAVIALGGGTVTVPAAREAIRAACRDGRGVAVYLRCDETTLVARLRAETGDRPSLTGATPVDEVRQVLAARAAIYESAADIVLDCGDDDAATLVTRLEEAVQSRTT